MNMCVTGGAGFIGSHLTDRLLALGHQVVVIDNLSTGLREYIHPEATFYEMDIRDKALRQVLQDHQIDYVFHEAAQTMVPVSMKDPEMDCDINLMGLLNVLEGCREAGVKKILVPSSAAVYGDCTDLPLQETVKGEPSSFYGLTKQVTETYLNLYYRYFELPYVCYRYANVYGPRQGHGGEGGVVSIFCQLLQEGKEFHIFGDGEQTRDFIYVGDVVEANIAGLAEIPVGVYNVSTGISTSVLQMIKALEGAAGHPIPCIHEAERPGDIRHSTLDTKKAEEQLGWKAQVSLEDGLRKTHSYFAK